MSNSAPKYDNVSCSNCGASFGPGDHGFSHCDQHQPPEIWIPILIRNEYDKAPDHYTVHDTWDDGADDIARKIIERFDVLRPTATKVSRERFRQVMDDAEASRRGYAWTYDNMYDALIAALPELVEDGT